MMILCMLILLLFRSAMKSNIRMLDVDLLIYEKIIFIIGLLNQSSYSSGLGLLFFFFFLVLSSFAAFSNYYRFISPSAFNSSNISAYYSLKVPLSSDIFDNFSCSSSQSLLMKSNLSYPRYAALLDLTFPKRFKIDEDYNLPISLAYFSNFEFT